MKIQMIDLYYQKKKRGNYLHKGYGKFTTSIKGVNYTDTLLTFPILLGKCTVKWRVPFYAIPIEDREKLSRPMFAHFGE